MAHTNPWSDTLPPVGELAKLIGVDMRQTRLDIHERMTDIGVDLTADPCVIGANTSLKRIIPFTAFLADLHAKENDISNGFLNIFVGNEAYAPVDNLPVGCIIRQIEWLLDKNTCASVDCDLRKKHFVNASPNATVVNTTNIATSGSNIVASATFTEVIASDWYYYLRVGGNGSAGNNLIMLAARITFDRPSLTQAT